MDRRLQVVAEQIPGATHADIGSDHGQLLLWLLQRGRIAHALAIENKTKPWENSCRALARFIRDGKAEVRLGDGLQMLCRDEVDSVSICGMGAHRMVDILHAHPDRVPERVIVQPNRQPELLRTWAIANRMRLVSEQVVRGRWVYHVMTFARTADPSVQTKLTGQTLADDQGFMDPAYEGIDHQAALLFGPLNLRRADPTLKQSLLEERERFRCLRRIHEQQRQRLDAIAWSLDFMETAGETYFRTVSQITSGDRR